MSDKRKDPQVSLAALQQEVQGLLEQARSARQELDATRRQILDSQIRASHQMLGHIEAINQLRLEIREMMKQLEGFREEDLRAVREMGEQLANAPLFHPQFEELLARKAAAGQNGRNFDDQLREQVLDRLDEFAFFPGQQENAARHAAIKTLASADKPDSDEELPALVALLLSRQPAAGLAPDAAAKLMDELKDGLKEYLNRIRREEKSLRNSAFGRHASNVEPDESMEDFEGLRELLEKMKDAFADSIQLGGPSPKLESLIEEYGLDDEEQEDREDEMLSHFLEDMLDESEGLMFSEDFDPESGFDDDDDGEWEDWIPADNPRYLPGSAVIVVADRTLGQGFSDINVKGWQGRIEEALTNGEMLLYIVALDSITLKQLPESYIEYTCEEEYGSFSRYEFEEEDLAPAQPRDSEEEAAAMQRELFHRFFWGNIDEDEQAARLYRIMLHAPAAEDIDNWITYFRNEVEFPFPAVVEGLILQHIEPGTEVEVLGIEGFDEEDGFGLVASIKKGRAILSYPLMELMPADDHDPRSWPLLDYRYWADLML